METEIIKQVILVRQLQKAYFKLRQKTDLIRSKEEEAKLDKMLLNYEVADEFVLEKMKGGQN